MVHILLTHAWLRACLHGGGGPRSSGVGFFCFHALGGTKQKKLTPLARPGSPTPCKQGLSRIGLYTINSMVYWLGKEVDQCHIDLESRWHGQKTIDQPRFQEQRPSCLFTSELRIMAFTRLFEDEIASIFWIKLNGKKAEYAEHIAR